MKNPTGFVVSYTKTQENGVVLHTVVRLIDDEYIVKLFEDGIENEDAAYYTDDEDDAKGTAIAMVNPSVEPSGDIEGNPDRLTLGDA